MKRGFLLGSCLLAMVAAAWPAAAAQYNWTGFYVGLNAGGASGSSDVDTSTVFSPVGYFASTSVTSINGNGNGSLSSGGFTGGGQGGFNWQTGNFVLGLETDLGYLGLSDSRTVGPVVYPCCSPTTYSFKQSVKTDNLFTVRPRFGWAANNWLFYLTGGLAVTSMKTSFDFNDTFAAAHANGSKTSIQPGWTAGGGVEFGLGSHWTLRAEYLFAQFNSVSLTSSNLTAFGVVPFPANTFRHKGDLESHIGRIAVNFRF